jgi:hypothetical protein
MFVKVIKQGSNEKVDVYYRIKDPQAYWLSLTSNRREMKRLKFPTKLKSSSLLTIFSIN